MLLRWRVPKTIQWIVKLFFIMLLVFTLFRLSTYFAFKPEQISFADVIPSFILGVLYDIRWVCFILLPILLFSYIPKFSPYSSPLATKVWTSYLAVITFIAIFFFGADFGQFAYVSTRLSASALNFYEDGKISFEMLWESYPLFWIFLALIIVGYIFYRIYRNTHQRVEKVNSKQEISYRRNWYLLATFFMALGIYGSVSSKPLKFDDAFLLKDNFKVYLALNPLQNFFTTLRFRKPDINQLQATQHYPLIKEYLQLDSMNVDGYSRLIAPRNGSLESKPNVVLVLCESFSMYKSSMSGNPLNTTPFFNEMCDDGIFFERCFSPHFSTARGLFSTITGIPDVQRFQFSSRIPANLNHHTIINNFEDYEKFYFLGGSSEFNNFKGIINNINGVNRVDEGKFAAPKLNVWGISDKDLFLEANKTFIQQQKPFFAIIQTADNHRPFTIPEADKDFVKVEEMSKDTLQKYGFLSLDEYNAFRYSDYCFKKFIEAAKHESYFENTIFVFIGDHGVEGNAKAVYPNVWTEQRLNDQHVPLIFYAPKLLLPAKRREVVSQIDVLPTVAGLIHQPYLNTTLGRDLLNPNKRNNGAFVIHHDPGIIGWITDSFYFTKNIRFEQEMIFPLNSNTSTWSAQQEAEMKKKASAITTAFYETAKWMLVNNKKSR